MIGRCTDIIRDFWDFVLGGVYCVLEGYQIQAFNFSTEQLIYALLRSCDPHIAKTAKPCDKGLSA